MKRLSIVTLLALLVPTLAWAQAYPSKVVENVGGAGGTIGAAKASPDGHALLTG